MLWSRIMASYWPATYLPATSWRSMWRSGGRRLTRYAYDRRLSSSLSTMTPSLGWPRHLRRVAAMYELLRARKPRECTAMACSLGFLPALGALPLLTVVACDTVLGRQ